MQAQKDAYNRRHNDHEHSMTLSTPRSDSFGVIIPNNTIMPMHKKSFKLPFRYLRTWVFSLLALVCLPIGIGMVMVGMEMQDNLTENWDEVTATVIRNDETGVEYSIGNADGEIGYTLDDFVDTGDFGELVWSVSVCDIISRVIIPKERGAEFTMWVDPDKSSNQSCVPINQDFASIYLVTGFILIIFSAIRLLRTIHSAGLRPA